MAKALEDGLCFNALNGLLSFLLAEGFDENTLSNMFQRPKRASFISTYFMCPLLSVGERGVSTP